MCRETFEAVLGIVWKTIDQLLQLIARYGGRFATPMNAGGDREEMRPEHATDRLSFWMERDDLQAMYSTNCANTCAVHSMRTPTVTNCHGFDRH